MLLSNKYNLNLHNKNCKGKINKLQCQICNEIFTFAQNKYRHEKKCKEKQTIIQNITNNYYNVLNLIEGNQYTFNITPINESGSGPVSSITEFLYLKPSSILNLNSTNTFNNGVILKNNNNIEFTTSSAFNLKYFSGNTNTIYAPCLEFRWNDSSYNTGSLSLASANSVITIGNNQGTYQQESIQRFKINVRDRFPARAFQTTSVYLNNKALPEESYYSIKDLDTEEIVVDYDTTYTKISCDPTGNYFDVYMSGLEPERYYKLLIKTTISGSTTVFDDNYFFKVIR